MFKRAVRTEAKHFFELGRYIGKKSKLTSSSFSSGAYGDSDYEMVDTLGRFQIDLLVIMKREYKLRKYSLNFVAEHFLGDQKVDMPYKEMFKKYKGDSKDRHDVGVYCVRVCMCMYVCVCVYECMRVRVLVLACVLACVRVHVLALV